MAPPVEEEELPATDEDGDSLEKGEEPVVDQEGEEVVEPALVEEPVEEEVKPITGFWSQISEIWNTVDKVGNKTKD